MLTISVERDVIDVTDLVDAAVDVLERARLTAPGDYCRFAVGGNEVEPNPYGVADAANIFYTINRMPDAAGRAEFVEALQRLQNPQTGLWHEATHHPLHTTAHCLAALELFDARPIHPLRGLDAYRSIEGLTSLLDSLEWVTDPWSQSHRGAGVFASLLIVDEATPEWRDAYFHWLANNWDPEFGMLRRGGLPGQATDSKPIHEHMAGTFHYLFNIEADRRPIPHPEAMIDTCLTMMAQGHPKFWEVGFLMIDWVFCLNRARRQTPHRHQDVHDALEAAGRRYIDAMRSLDHQNDRSFNDVHALFGTMTSLAELQIAIPGLIRSGRPLRNVMDRRPFI